MLVVCFALFGFVLFVVCLFSSRVLDVFWSELIRVLMLRMFFFFFFVVDGS